ncbi:MAG: riboflavin biosynthesis protein RibD [Proteobacteria bacterium]|nr:riboflavin biosynthesis protein RibD [Pseudomonadota bacterium]
MSPATVFSALDARFMARALELAERGLLSTPPNPRVGCVIVRGEQIVGEGWHRVTGGPHAEIEALRAAGDAARGATVYVTLEPCCHHGRTPPCADALIAAGVARVIAAMEDPNPRVAGNGLHRLREAGIDTACGLLASQAEALNPGFCRRMREGRPFVVSKLAMSLDGRTAMASGESRWITEAAARRDSHRLRARSSALVTGIGTVLADDPELTVRLDGGSEGLRQPARVVLDSQLRMPATSRMLRQPGRTIIVTLPGNEGNRADALRAAGAEIAFLPADDNRQIDLGALLPALGSLEFNEVMVEAGPVLNGALLRAGLVDEWVVYMAPVVLGDRGRGLFQLPGLERMADRFEFELLETRQVGEDLRLRFGKRQPS